MHVEDMGDGEEEYDGGGAAGAEGDEGGDAATVGFVPQLRIVNGQIVLDEESMQVTATRAGSDFNRCVHVHTTAARLKLTPRWEAT